MNIRVAFLSVAVAIASCAPAEDRDETPSAISTPAAPYAGVCSHGPCAVGVKLASSCDSCVASVCAQDSYCCRTKWDQQCINEVGTYCGSSYCAGGGAADMSAPPPDLGGGTGGGGGGGGGGVGLLKFAVFGDCRPPNHNDTSGYPSAIVTGIFKLAQAQRRPIHRRHRRLHVRDDGERGDRAGRALQSSQGELHRGPHLSDDGQSRVHRRHRIELPEPQRDAQHAGLHARWCPRASPSRITESI